MQPKDIALAPIYLYQARKLKRTALTLPEAEGNRYGIVDLKAGRCNDKPRQALSLMMVGDSSAAGVGVNHQEEALLGHLLKALQDTPAVLETFSEIDWSLHATSGHTSFDILRRLYVIPSPPVSIDVLIVLAGVNDTTANVSHQKWQEQLEEIIALGRRKFGVKHFVFPDLPPMAHMPAIPAPLSHYVGAKSDLLNVKLQEVSQRHADVTTLQVDFSVMGKTAEDLFSEDGFHPNSLAYEFWAQRLAEHLVDVIKNK